MSTAQNQLVTRQEGDKRHHPVAASTHLYQGTLSFINASGYLDDDTASGVNKFAGVVTEEKDNSSGSNGDLKAEVLETGEFPFSGTGFTQASVGKKAYATDNFTVAAGYAANGVNIGTIVEYISSTKVVVRINVQSTNTIVAVGNGYAIARGQQTTVAASDTVVTGLSTVVCAVATLDSDPVDDPEWATASIGDQAGAPAAGSILIKTWKNTGGTDPTPAAATTFSKKVNWIAIGTL